MKKVSVICPVYNAAGCIGRFLSSMAAQTLDDVEVVLVDDHGADDSMDVARKVSQELGLYTVFVDGGCNRGPGGARNIGVAAATSRYVAFVDSDDTVAPDFLQRLYEAAERTDAELACGSISFDAPDGTSTLRTNPQVEGTSFTGGAKRHFLRHYKSYFTTFLYRRSFLLESNITFPPTHSAEDSCFLLCALLAAQRMAQDEAAVYHYLLSPQSVSRKKDPLRWKNRLSSFRRVRTYARQHALYRPYWGILEWLIFKKGALLAVKDLLSNL